MTILERMQQIRAEFPLGWTHEDRGKYLNKVAWSLKQSGEWPNVGLLAKPGGNNCPTSQGVLVSCDYLVDRVTLNGYDVLINETSPYWSGFDGPSDNFVNAPQRWVAPIDPQGQIPVPVPIPVPTPRLPNLGVLEARVGALETLVGNLEAVGRTSRVWGHAHDVTLDIRRKV